MNTLLETRNYLHHLIDTVDDERLNDAMICLVSPESNKSLSDEAMIALCEKELPNKSRVKQSKRR